MNPEFLSANGSLGSRVAQMRELIDELTRMQAALLVPDWHAIELHASRQRQLCHAFALGELTGPNEQQKHEEAEGDSQGTLTELVSLVRHASYLNRVNRALVRRQQRALRILSNLQARRAATYAASPLLTPGPAQPLLEP